MGRGPRPARLAGAWVLATLNVSCTTDYYLRDADQEVDELLTEFDQVVLANRARRVEQPDILSQDPAPSGQQPIGEKPVIDADFIPGADDSFTTEFLDDQPADDQSVPDAAHEDPKPAAGERPGNETPVIDDAFDPQSESAFTEEFLQDEEPIDESDVKSTQRYQDDAAKALPTNEETPGDEDQATDSPEDGSPRPTPAQTGDSSAFRDSEEPSEDVLYLDLETALKLATRGNRDYESQRESLYLQGLGFSLTKFNFGPQLNSTASYVWSNSRDGLRSSMAGLTFNASQILPTGGALSLASGVGSGLLEGSRNDRDFDSTVSLNLTQPLLRGAGYKISHEPLIQAERNLIYAVRNFELFRQDFAIDVAETFFNLVNQQKSLVIQEQRYKDALFDFNKARALRRVDRNDDEDVFRAQREENSSKIALIDAQTELQRSLDDFQIDLGLPTTTGIVIVDEEPPYNPIRIDPESAMAVAVTNRLDVQTQFDRLEDIQRALNIAENSLLPDVDLNASAARNEFGLSPGSGVVDLHSDWSTSYSLNVEIPLQRKPERNAYRATLIAVDQAKRDLDEFLDGVRNQAEDAIRQLHRTEEQIELQKERIASDQRLVIVAEIRHEAGLVDNRDLLEARQTVANAQIQLNNLQAEHFIRSLRMRRTLGILFIDENGVWQE